MKQPRSTDAGTKEIVGAVRALLQSKPVKRLADELSSKDSDDPGVVYHLAVEQFIARIESCPAEKVSAATTAEIILFDDTGEELGRVAGSRLTRDPALQANRDHAKMTAFKAAHPPTACAKVFLPSGTLVTEYTIDVDGNFVNRARAQIR